MKKLLLPLLLIGIFASPSIEAIAACHNCTGTETRFMKRRPSNSGSSNSASNAAIAAGVIGALIGAANSASNRSPAPVAGPTRLDRAMDDLRSFMEGERAQAVSKDRKARQQEAQNAKKYYEKLVDETAADASLDPWASKTVSSNRTKPAEYADSKCASFTPMGNDRFVYDLINVQNNCSFDIEVLVCWQNRQPCDPSRLPYWATTSTISPGGQTTTVALGKPPFKYRYFVCDVSDIDGYKPLCLLPKRQG